MGELGSMHGQHLMDAPALLVPRVMVVSSVLLYREGLAASIAADGRLNVIAMTDPVHAYSEASICSPQAMLVDVTTQESLAMARNFKCQVNDIPVVGFGISNSPASALACAEAGLAGFVDENGSIDVLVETTLRALRGEFCCSPRIAALLCERLASLANRVEAHGEPAACLTPRELEIASLVSRGLSNKEIALDLRIGPATVKNHVHNILDKLNVRRRAAIASRVIETAG
jgi:DNA-binding NarL/FixJ family response regulator